MHPFGFRSMLSPCCLIVGHRILVDDAILRWKYAASRWAKNRISRPWSADELALAVIATTFSLGGCLPPDSVYECIAGVFLSNSLDSCLGTSHHWCSDADPNDVAIY